MNEVKIFESPLFGQVRVVTDVSNEPLFCLGDICKALGLRTGDVKARLNKGVVSTQPLATRGGTQQVTFVNEDGFYDVVLDSKKPEAKAFRKWITSEVLPSIRKTGGYMVDRAEDTPEDIMARAVLVAQQTLARREERIKQLEADNDVKAQTIDAQAQELKVAAPKVKFYDDTLASTDCMTTTQIANELGMYTGMLNKKLAEAGIQHKQSNTWLLNKPYREWGMHGTRTFDFTHGDGTNGARTYTVWNQRGRRFIHALYNNNFNVKQAVAEIKGEFVVDAKNNKNK